jgi:large subunit ribosomal protein L4
MELQVSTIDGKKSGSLKVSDEVFGLEPRADILQRMVRYQLAKRQQGSHATKGRSDISLTGAKFGNQKGGGRARHGSRRSNIFVGGGKAHGPVQHSHAIGLPKKVRALALRHALSAKVKSGDLIVIKDGKVKDAKTKALQAGFTKLGLGSALVIDGAEVEANLKLAAKNIPQVDVLPVQGINVYDILRRDKLVLTTAAIEVLEARFK